MDADEHFFEKRNQYLGRVRIATGRINKIDGKTEYEIPGYVMIRPDGENDAERHRYRTESERKIGREASRKWFAYLTRIGAKRTLMAWRAMLRRGISVMVVCADPVVFDLDYVPMRDDDHFEFDERSASRRPIDPGLIAKIAHGMRMLGRSMRPGGGEMRTDAEIAQDDLDARRAQFAETIRKNRENPVELSAEARHRLTGKLAGSFYGGSGYDDS